MKLENQVICLPLAKQLKELGITKPSHYSFFGDENHFPEPNKPWVFLKTTEPVNLEDRDYRGDVDMNEAVASSYSTSELGEMIPWSVIHKPEDSKEEIEYSLYFSKNFKSGAFFANYYADPDEYATPLIPDDIQGTTEADLRALLLIYLINNKFITAQQVNEGLIN